MSNEFRREYLVRLPLPLAQLYGRAYNAKDGRGRHDNCFYLCESLIKLSTGPLIAGYLDEARREGGRVAAIDQLLVQLALPSLGQWTGFLRELARHFGSRPHAASHPLGHLWDQLNTKRRDLAGVLALFRRIKNGPEGELAGDQSCSLLQLIDALVQYRNTVFGHGAGRVASFYEEEMGPLLFPAVNELLAEGTFDLLGPRGSKLVYLVEVKTVEAHRVELGMRELVGLQSERMAPLVLDAKQAEGLLPDRVAVTWPGRKAPLLLDPLLIYRENELSEDVLFLNRDRNGKQVEYLSYSTGQTERDKSMVPAMARMLSEITGKEVTEERLEALKEKSLAETISVEAIAEPAQPATRVLGDYEILTELGRGGMGVVYLARQFSLGRLVALKMLPADMAGDEVALARFRREMRALGRCEHPNIVKVLSSGTLPDGQLYYAMEYVPGADLEQTWCELAGPNREGSAKILGGTTWHRAIVTASGKTREKSRQKTNAGRADPTKSATEQASSTPSHETLLPPLPELPSREEDPGGYERRVAMMIRDAARALQSVHDQNILHRDIKPANLMLTPDGSRVVLMDFGLAKGDEMSLTTGHSAGFLGTLRYCAPEQLAAAQMKVGPQADVRALGITMWELLTRHRLFGEAQDERQLTSWVLGRDVPRLRAIDPTLDVDLEAIVARATERGEENRIQSAREMADYLDLYLQGKPIPIRIPGLVELAKRWVREHAAIATSAAAAILTILIAVVVAFVLITRARNDAINARNVVSQQNTKLKAAYGKQADYLTLARGAVDEMLTQVGMDSLKDVPQMEEVRKELLTKARTFYETFSEETPEDPFLRMEVAVAWRRIADVSRIESDVAKADSAYRESIRLLETLAAQQAEQSEYQRELALSFNNLGWLLQRPNPPAAIKELDQAIRVQKELLERADFEPIVQQQLARSFYNRGIAYNHQGDQPQAMADYKEAISLLQSLLDAQTTEVNPAECRQELARCHSNLAKALRSKDDALEGDAIVHYEAAIAIAEDLVKSSPATRSYREELATYSNNLANLLLGQKELLDALEANSTALQQWEYLNQALPHFRNELANTLTTRSVILEKQEQRDQVRQNLMRVEQLYRGLVEENSDDPQLQDRLGNALYGQATLRYRQSDFEGAKRLLAESLARHLLGLLELPEDPDLMGHLANDRTVLDLVFKKLGKPQQASTKSPMHDAIIEAARLLGEAMGDVAADGELTAADAQTMQDHLADATVQLAQSAVHHQIFTLSQFAEQFNEDGAFSHLKAREEFEAIEALLKSGSLPQN